MKTVNEVQEEIAAKTFKYLMEEGASLSAVTVVCDNTQMVVIPLRLNMEQALTALRLACLAIAEQENAPENKGEMH